MWRRAQQSVRKAVLQTVFAVRGAWSRRSSLDPALTGRLTLSLDPRRLTLP